MKYTPGTDMSKSQDFLLWIYLHQMTMDDALKIMGDPQSLFGLDDPTLEFDHHRDHEKWKTMIEKK
jgi:hypothetical protein